MDDGRELNRRALQENGGGLSPVSQLKTTRVPMVGLAAALRRHWRLALVPVVALVVLAIAIGASRSPTFTAETIVSVGDVSQTSEQALAGFTGATRAIADTYARSIASDRIILPVARRLDRDPEEIKDQVEAAPVPESSVLVIRAQASSGDAATVLVNEVADSLVRVSEDLADARQDRTTLLRRYEQAEVEVANASAEAQAAQEAYDASETRETQEELADALAEKKTAQVAAVGLRESYQAAVVAGGAAAVATVIESATGASSDRFSFQGLMFIIAIAAGLVIGLALALLRANIQARRLLA